MAFLFPVIKQCCKPLRPFRVSSRSLVIDHPSIGVERDHFSILPCMGD